jgi:hypothetical protein
MFEGTNLSQEGCEFIMTQRHSFEIDTTGKNRQKGRDKKP